MIYKKICINVTGGKAMKKTISSHDNRKKIGFTGTRNGMTNEQKESFRELLVQFNPEEFHHGDCIGADEDAHNIAKEFNIKIHIHPPINNAARANCDSDKLYEAKDYISRNHDIVDSVDLLVATPKGSKEELRSGTWATIRYAYSQNKNVIIISPKRKK